MDEACDRFWRFASVSFHWFPAALTRLLPDPSGPAAESGIQAGDVIQEVSRQPVRSPADIPDALQKSNGRPPLLLINRRGQTFFLALGQGQ